MKKILLSLTVLLILGLAKSNAQSELTSVVTTKISSVAEISAVGGNKDGALFDFTSASQLTTGIVISNVFTLEAKANKDYYVNVKASAENFSGGDSEDPLPVDKLSISVDGGSFKTLSATEQDIIGSSTGVKITRGTKQYIIGYKMVPGLDAAPAQNYTTTLTYTISAP